ncbi:MAG: TIM barrel protein [Solibacillus sp.]
MSIILSGAPCCWGVDDPKNPNLPPWQLVLQEAAEAGYKGIELGPYGYMPIDGEHVKDALANYELSIVAGTIFDDLVSPRNFPNLLCQVDEICTFITAIPAPARIANQSFTAPFLTVMDWGHDERDFCAGHVARAPRLSNAQWATMMEHIRAIATRAWENYGVRAVIHPHAGGYIEFEDEVERLLADIPYEVAGLCLDTGHLYYSKMDPVEWLTNYAHRLDYLHFKDIDLTVYERVMQMDICFFDACAIGVMCPIGKGCLNYPAILQALKDMNYQGYITIEQERDPRNTASSLEDVKQSVNYLVGIGF